MVSTPGSEQPRGPERGRQPVAGEGRHRVVGAGVAHRGDAELDEIDLGDESAVA